MAAATLLPPFLPLATIQGTPAERISSLASTTFTKPTGTPTTRRGRISPVRIFSYSRIGAVGGVAYGVDAVRIQPGGLVHTDRRPGDPGLPGGLLHVLVPDETADLDAVGSGRRFIDPGGGHGGVGDDGDAGGQGLPAL